jgi:hypothetical protein
MFRKRFDEYPLEKLLKKYKELDKKRMEFCRYLVERVASESCEAFKKFNQANQDGIKIKAFFVRIATYWKPFIQKHEVSRSFRINASESMVEVLIETDLEIIVHKIYSPRWGTKVMDPTLPVTGLPEKEVEKLEQMLTEFLRNELLVTKKRRGITRKPWPIVYVLRLPENPPTIYTHKFVEKTPCWFICSKAQNIDSGFFYFVQFRILKA